jgi:hypothetical protein
MGHSKCRLLRRGALRPKEVWASVKENVINPFSDLLPHADTGRCVHGFTGCARGQPAIVPSPRGDCLSIQTRARCFALESALETGILDHLAQRDATVSLVTFGSQEPVLRIANAKPSDAIDTITNVNLQQSREKYFAVHLYEAMDLALKMFKSEAKPQFRDLLFHHC